MSKTNHYGKKNLHADVIIVGSGIAGALISYRLAKNGFHVICLEAGPEIQRPDILGNFKRLPGRDFQAPYVNSPHAPFPSGRSNDGYLESVGENDYTGTYLRGVGGTTWHWAGHSWRFLSEDFRERSSFGVGLDMPVTYEELEPYYFEAETEMGVAGVSSPLNYYHVHRKNPYPLPPVPLSYLDTYVSSKIQSIGLSIKSAPSARNTLVYDERPQCCGSNNCMPICPIGAQYSASVHIDKALQFKNMQLLSNAIVDQIVTKDHKKVEAIQFRDPRGNAYHARGKFYVLAAGGIETPKLLLLSNIGNDQVGRNLMDHPILMSSFAAQDDVFPGRGPMVIGSITEHQTGSFRQERTGFRINLKNFFLMQDIIREQIEAGQFGTRLRERIDHRARRAIGLEIFLGQLPDPNNRVSLSTSHRDILGIPHPRIHYQIGKWTQKAVKPIYDVCKEIAQACGHEPESFKFDYHQLAPSKRFSSGNHIMGTTLMGNDPLAAVTDPECRVYSKKHHEPMTNLFISSSGLLSATGVNNVTLTVAAFSLRLAEKLQMLLKT